jgi:hypothetical protein
VVVRVNFMSKMTLWAAGMTAFTLAACASQQADEAHPSISKAAHTGILIGPASFLVVGDEFEKDARLRCFFTPEGQLKEVTYEHTAMATTVARMSEAEDLCKAEFKGFAKPR